MKKIIGKIYQVKEDKLIKPLAILRIKFWILMDWKSIIMKNSMIKVTLKTYKTYSNNNNKLLIRSIMIINVPKMVNNKKMIRNIN